MNAISEILITVLIETILISGILGYVFSRREERMKKTIEEEFTKRGRFFEAQFNYKLKALEELLAPVRLQFIRSQITLKGYDANNVFRERILKECNETILGLLINKGHLMSVDLIPFAEKLISHYDEWLQAYYQAREVEHNTEIRHVFTYNFPKDAEKAFIEKFESYRKELEIEKSIN